MCGIVGAIGIKNTREFLIKGLKDLDYRGYDSAGVAFNKKTGIEVFKSVGTVDKLDSQISCDDSLICLGIGHTRWATHGEPSTINSHPHVSMHGEFAIVHNGVIENYRSVKENLVKLGYEFKSETDTEVIVNLLEYHYLENKDVLESIYVTMQELKGSFALAIIKKDDTDHIYFAKNRSPLLIGEGNDFKLLASDAMPMIKYTDKFIDLADYQYGFISSDKVTVLRNKKSVEVKYTKRNAELLNRDLGDYPHYMLKEIEEGPQCIKRIINNYFDGSKYLFDHRLIEEIKEAKDIIFLACGTSYHASLIGKRYFENINKHAEVFIASEWAYNPIVLSDKPFFIIVSQSGETADLIRCLDIINNRNSHSLTITNTKGSTLEREATYSLLLYAGVEVAVASTKAYISQVALLSLLVAATKNDYSCVSNLKAVIDAEQILINNHHECKKVADELSKHQNVFFLGRGLDFAVAQEGSLKLKEITYIHSEALPGGELKHGPIALINNGTPVIVFITNPLIDLPIRSNICEVESRGAKVFTIVSKALRKDNDSIIIPDVDLALTPLVSVVVAQYISYYTALKLNLNIDKPRNLAKSVTVE